MSKICQFGHCFTSELPYLAYVVVSCDSEGINSNFLVDTCHPMSEEITIAPKVLITRCMV